MAEDRRVSGSYPHELAKVRVAQIAKRQHNRIASHQLTRLGVSGSTVRDWMRAGYLHPRLRGVYAVGSPARTTESDLFEAVLYAGPGAMLSHVTAASWLGLIDHARRDPRLDPAAPELAARDPDPQPPDRA